jgi:signal transduction histidine kinase
MRGKEDRYRFQSQLGRLLEQTEDHVKLYKTALGQIARHMGAEAGAVILRSPVSGELHRHGWGRGGADWSESDVRAFLDQKHPPLRDNEIMAPILTRGLAMGVMALRRKSGAFPIGAGRWLARLCRKLGHEATLHEERRVNRIIDLIKDKTVRELRPKDLFYQVLHGIRTLTRYDHSSAILIAEEDGARLVLHAEQIAWAKRKSDRIGRRIKVPEVLRAGLRRTSAVSIVSFPSAKGKGSASTTSCKSGNGAEGSAVARLMRWGGKGPEPAEGTVLLAPLHHDGELLGVLKIATVRAGVFGAFEAAAVSRVLRHVASVIHNARRALSMEERIIEAEKKHAMADLARAISHDVKNAIGAILPLAQQSREELEAGTFDRQVLNEDLRQIELSARTCQRIFDGMLQLARSGVRPVEAAPLSTIMDGALSILGTRLKRSGIVLEFKVPDDLPDINASRGGLEQLFLNLFSNALESMSAGGKLKVSARAVGKNVEVKISDTGAGIPEDQLKKIHEPFYTTKAEGFGLGLAICRSILWDIGGEMSIDSRPSKGTVVRILLPIHHGTREERAPVQGAAAKERGAPVRQAGLDGDRS